LHLTWHGGNSTQFIIVWFFIALWTLVDPTFHQCCSAARDAGTARRGILLSIVFWFIFDVMTTTAGLYSRAILPPNIDPVAALPLLADAVLPPLVKGVFFVGILATVLSTLTAFSFLSAQLLGRDLVLRMFGSFKHSARATQWGLAASLLLSALLVLRLPSVIDLWYTLGTVAIPGLLVPLLSSYIPGWRLRPWLAAPTMFAGWLTSFLWLLAGSATPEGTLYPLGIEPMYPGLTLTLVIWALDRAVSAVDLRLRKQAK
jgi:SSS family solute:Na+ symporter